MRLAALILGWTMAAWGGICPANYGWYQSYTVAAGQITGTLTDFPAVLPISNTNWKTTGNGGKSADPGAQGYDIVVTDGANLMQFELEGHGGSSTTYDGTAGSAVIWVRIPSAAVGSIVYVCMGNSSISTYQGSTNADATHSAWASKFLAVWHLNNGSTASYADATPNGYNGTNTSTTATSSGQVDGAIALSGSSQYVSVAQSANALTPANFTLEGWVYSGGQTAYQTPFAEPRSPGAAYDFAVKLDSGSSGNKMRCYAYKGNSGTLIGPISESGTFSTSTWYHYACKWDGTNLVLYRNGANVGSTTGTGSANTDGGTYTFSIGYNNYSGTPQGFWNGRLDEVRLQNVGQSDAWIAATYNNASAPATFWTVGSLTPYSPSTKVARRLISGGGN